MLYWYASRGDASRRGVADERVLFEMVKKGQLRPTDLVWNASTGARWVSASTIEGLFPEGYVAPGGEAPADGAASQGSRRRPWVIALVAAAAAVAVFGIVIAYVIVSSGRKPAAKPHSGSTDFLTSRQRAALESTNASAQVRQAALVSAKVNAVAALSDKIAVCFGQERFDEAERLIAEMRLQEGGAEQASRLSGRLDAMKKTIARRTALESGMRDGSVDRAGADELLQIYLAGAPSNRTAWVDLAALLCARDARDSAIKALKHGIERGDDTVRNAVRGDARFAPLRDSREFKDLVGAQ
jgi:hypothetical protein